MLRSLFLVLTLPGLSVTVAKAGPLFPPAMYTIEVPSSLDALRVKACFEAGGTFSLESASPQTSRLLTGVESGNGASVARRGDRIEVRNAADDTCLVYRVDLTSATWRGNWRGGFVVTTGAILIDPDLFLWLPEGTTDVGVEFRLPPGYSVSAPWESLAMTERGDVFRTGVPAGRRDGKVALGRLEKYRIEVDAAEIEVAILNGVPASDKALIRRWLNANIKAVSAIYGRFPVPRLQLLVIPLGNGDEPVPWGQVSRSGGDAVHLYIDQRMSESAFMNDWVLSHELSHLFHPYISGDARWVYEGLASYYQSVSRARVGMMSAHEAWEDLHAGFERGRRGTRRGRTLGDATENMHAERAYMQVYWSGAAIFLLADLELRQATGQRLSLDRVLDSFAECCLNAKRVWTEQEFLEQLDRLSDSAIFTRLAMLYRDSDRFPDMTSAYERLGLQPRSGSELGFDSGSEPRAMRSAIMGGP